MLEACGGIPTAILVTIAHQMPCQEIQDTVDVIKQQMSMLIRRASATVGAVFRGFKT